MVLASQIGRPGSSRRTNNFRRSGKRLRKPMIAFVTLLAAYAVWHFWPGGGDGLLLTNTNPVVAAPASDAAAKAAVPPAQQAGVVPVASSNGGAPAAGSARTPAEPTRSQPNLAEGLRQLHDELKGGTSSGAPVAGPTVPNRTDDAPKAGPSAIAAAIKSEIESPAESPKQEEPAKAAAPSAGADTPIITLAQAGPINTQSLSVAVQAARVTLTTPGVTGATLRDGMNLIADGKLVEGRKVLSKVLIDPNANITAKDAQTIRDTLMSVNKSLLFSDRVLEGDTLVEQYTVQSGDLLSIIARKHSVTYQLLEQINRVDARRIRVGQKLKVLKGPFHVVVSKSSFRMDLFLRDTDNSWVYATSFPVGVGKDDSTPNGTWICRSGGKLANPSWTHPRTSEYFAPDDPKNPIGEYWIALDGTDETTKGLRGYGIHGTIDRDSIGKQMSLGCVRLLPEHIEQVYKLLVDGKSTVTIQP